MIRKIRSEGGEGVPTFVMPHYGWRPDDRGYLDEAIAGLLAQTDPDWRLVVVDDASPLGENREHLRDLAARYPARLKVLWSRRNRGTGVSRNRGVAYAARTGAPFILYHDADDLADPRRLESTRRVFDEDERAEVVYSRFEVIDERSRPVPLGSLTPSVREILDCLEADPPAGPGAEVLLRLGTQTGYATLTSTVAVRTDLAAAHPFPAEAVSEDAYTWFLYAAAADRVVCLPEVLTSYRIPQNGAGSSVRMRVGDSFYAEKARVDSEGFRRALDLAISGRRLDPARRPEVLRRFYERLAVTMRDEGEQALADGLARLAAGVAVP